MNSWSINVYSSLSILWRCLIWNSLLILITITVLLILPTLGYYSHPYSNTSRSISLYFEYYLGDLSFGDWLLTSYLVGVRVLLIIKTLHDHFSIDCEVWGVESCYIPECIEEESNWRDLRDLMGLRGNLNKQLNTWFSIGKKINQIYNKKSRVITYSHSNK